MSLALVSLAVSPLSHGTSRQRSNVRTETRQLGRSTAVDKAHAAATLVASDPRGTMRGSGDLVAHKTFLGIEVQKRRKGTTTTWHFATPDVAGNPSAAPTYERTTTNYDKAPGVHRTAYGDRVVWSRTSAWSKENGSTTTVKTQTKDERGRYGKAILTYTHRNHPDGSSSTTDHVRGTTTTTNRRGLMSFSQRDTAMGGLRDSLVLDQIQVSGGQRKDALLESATRRLLNLASVIAKQTKLEP